MRKTSIISPIRVSFVLIALLTFSSFAYGQETVFTLMRSDEKKAAAYYNAKNYRQALKLYESMSTHSKDDEYYLPIARSYYYLHEPKNAVKWYDKFVSLDKNLPVKDIFLFAESLSASAQYEQAIKYYTQYQALSNEDPIVMKKIWQLKNRSYLFEDSIHYTLTRISTNTDAADICPVPYGGGFVFISNRKRRAVIEKVDGSDVPFYKLYSSALVVDTTGSTMNLKFTSPDDFAPELNLKYQLGPVSFYSNEKKMAFIASGEPSPSDKNKRSLQLFFAEHDGKMWSLKNSFPFNNADISITSAVVKEDGTVLYFASDMPGGYGGLDLYSSSIVNGAWSKPVNLGETINTTGDESFPSISGNTLYFASNGHAGLGGLDIFKSLINSGEFGEVENIGYPVNTNYDDFALSLSKDMSKGFLTSNRAKTDDVYELIIDLQSYPFTIAGVLKYKEESWKDSGDLKIFPSAQLLLIDNIKNAVVGSATSDENGMFSLTIPYFSQYRIKVIGSQQDDEAFVSLDLSKTRYGENKSEIVVVKNSFKKAY